MWVGFLKVLPVCWKFGKSYVAANAGECTVVSLTKANYLNCQVINREADRTPFTVLSTLYPGDSRFRTVSPGLPD